MRSVVVFPAPFGPRKPVTRPPILRQQHRSSYEDPGSQSAHGSSCDACLNVVRDALRVIGAEEDLVEPGLVTNRVKAKEGHAPFHRHQSPDTRGVSEGAELAIAGHDETRTNAEYF